MEILRVPGEDSKCHFSYVISVGVCSCGYCVFFPNFVFFQAQREREREGENLPLEDTNLFCCHAVKSVVFFDDITVSLKMDYCCVKSFKCFLLHCCLLEDGLLLCEEF